MHPEHKNYRRQRACGTARFYLEGLIWKLVMLQTTKFWRYDTDLQSCAQYLVVHSQSLKVQEHKKRTNRRKKSKRYCQCPSCQFHWWQFTSARYLSLILLVYVLSMTRTMRTYYQYDIGANLCDLMFQGLCNAMCIGNLEQSWNALTWIRYLSRQTQSRSRPRCGNVALSNRDRRNYLLHAQSYSCEYSQYFCISACPPLQVGPATCMGRRHRSPNLHRCSIEMYNTVHRTHDCLKRPLRIGSASNLSESEEALSLAQRYPGRVYCTVGVHPTRSLWSRVGVVTVLMLPVSIQMLRVRDSFIPRHLLHGQTVVSGDWGGQEGPSMCESIHLNN